MTPARFVTLCFLYSGAVLVVSHVFTYEFRLGFDILAQGAVSLVIFLTGVVRLLRPEYGDEPEEWGLFTGVMALLALLVTLVVLRQLGLV